MVIELPFRASARSTCSTGRRGVFEIRKMAERSRSGPAASRDSHQHPTSAAPSTSKSAYAGTRLAPSTSMKITLRRAKLAWKYRKYRKLWEHRYGIGAALAGSALAAGILLRPKRILF